MGWTTAARPDIFRASLPTYAAGGATATMNVATGAATEYACAANRIEAAAATTEHGTDERTMTGIWLFAHVLGVILWMGLAVTLMFVTARARRGGDWSVTAFAYGTSHRLMKTVGLTGMILTVGGGFALTASLGHPYFQPFPLHWLFQMQLLGSLAFLLGVFVELPLSGRLAREARDSAAAGEATGGFEKVRKRRAIVGSVNGILLLAVTLLATLRP